MVCIYTRKFQNDLDTVIDIAVHSDCGYHFKILIAMFSGRKHCVLKGYVSFYNVKMVINPLVQKNQLTYDFGV